MRDRFLLPLMVLTGIGMIALSLVWPQGQGDRSPGPFGRPLEPVTADAPSDRPTLGLTLPERAGQNAPPAPPSPAPSGGLRPAQ
jgi:hypothetical protein